MNFRTKAIAIAVACALISAYAQAQSFTVDFQQTVASEEYDAVDNTFGPTNPGRFYHISVNTDNPGYASYIALDTDNSTIIPSYTRSFVDPIVGWSFIGPNGTANGELGINEESGGIATWTTTDQTDPITNTFDGFGQNQAKFWNATDPGSDFNVPADEAAEGATTHDKNIGGYRSFGQATATIDVSSLATGNLYVFYGAFSATPLVDAVLRDTDGSEPDIVIADFHLNADFANRSEYYAAEFSFDTTGGYDTIIYNYLQPGDDGKGTGSGNGRTGGIVLTGLEDSGPTPLAGDFNGDGTVDAADYTVYADNLGQADESAFAAGTGDGMNGVDSADYDLWRANFGNTTPPLLGGGGGAVPEPGTIALLAGGLGLGLIALRNRRK